MADKRQSFRFRFPWSHSSRSKDEPKPSATSKTQNPAQSTSKVVPDDRPPFRPAGKAPVKDTSTPSQVQKPQKTDPTPSHAASESPKTQSPSRLSPSKKPHTTTQQSSPPSPASSSQSQQVEEAIPQLKNHRRKIEILSETDSSAEDSTSRDTASLTPKGIKIFASSDTSDSDTLNADHNQLSDSETDSKEHKEAEKVVQVPSGDEKTNVPGYTEPLQERITQVHDAGKDSADQTKDPLGVALQAEQRHEKQEKVTELHAAAEDLETRTKHPLGDALHADQQHEKQERVSEPHAAATDAVKHATDEAALQANHQRQGKSETKERLGSTDIDEKPIKTDRSSSKVPIRKMVASKGEQCPPNKETREDVSKVDKLAISHQLLDQPVGVVTLTGENRGEAMHLSSEPGKREEAVRIRHNYKLNPDDDNEDGEASTREDMLENQTNEGDQQRSTYINSNVQSINNSLVYNSSVTERNPGVAVSASNPPEANNSNKEFVFPQTHKSQVIQTPADRLIYESTVRRRCLRGLFLESSDSEPDNPAKPQRHGCRYVCGKRSKETDIGIV